MSILNNSLLTQARLVRLTQDHQIKPFDCGNHDLNMFLLTESKDYLKCLMYVTYILETPDKTIAYYCVSNDLLKISLSYHKRFKSSLRKSASKNILYSLFKWNEFPAVKIGRFAVDKEYQNQKIGGELLNAIVYSFSTNNKTGCSFITVNALNDPATLNFYKNNDFIFLTQSDLHKDSRLMYKCLL